MISFRLRLTVLCLASGLFMVSAPAALSAASHSGSWLGKVTKGQALKGKNGEPTFRVKGSKLTRFKIPGVGGFCYSGYRVVSVYVPSATIRHGRFTRVFHPVKDANIKLTGRFLSARRAKGTVTSSGVSCDYTIRWVAHRR